MPAPRQPADRFSRRFEEVGAQIGAGAVAQAGVCERYQPPGGTWSLDYGAGLLRVGEVTVHQSPLGSLGHDGSWLWAWANEGTHPPGSPRLTLAEWLREFGERHQVHELAAPRLELAEFPDPLSAARRLALVALGVVRTRGVADVRLESGARAFVLVDDPAVPEAVFDGGSLPGLFAHAIGLFPYDPRQTVAGYLRRHGFATHEATDGRHVHGERDEATVAVRFTEDGLIAAVSHGARPGAQSARAVSE
ncbi:hypothetical protein OG875_18005 [Streptomyces sp. NBC_01498]|uniref:DUF6882 domain-containing protein n=1 Tax=Streptomyces sp. NBC_01498 TaxID=2975870 RepID=UPI002E7BF5A7|nr:DUF6882 domain-containing protein [Streptomyces sp. NBC_01498]WTL26314.1 hypothetical protein OG875_18005 [Streptomyces sp. NBC_01498]